MKGKQLTMDAVLQRMRSGNTKVGRLLREMRKDDGKE